jgi:hypothetical protein
MSARGVVVAMVLAIGAGLALIFVAWPGTTYGTVTPWDVIVSLILRATQGARRPLIVLGLGAAVAGAIVVATIWLSRRAADGRPG